MTSAFIPLATRSVRNLSTSFTSAPSHLSSHHRHHLHTLTKTRIIVKYQQQQRYTQQPLRMQCTPTGKVPDMNDTVVGNMERKINDALSPSRLQIVPTTGDPNGAHVQIEVISDRFEGMSPVKRHQAVYQAIWEELEVSFSICTS